MKTFPSRLFTHCFKRPMGPQDEAHLRFLRQTQGLTLEQTVHHLMQSPEYQGINGLTSILRASDIPRPRLCFVHFEKTAGTSLHDYFLEIYPPHEVFPERLHHLDRYTEDQFLASRLYSGHFYLSDCWRIPPGTQFLTMLRNPVERIVSLYRFWHSLSIPGDGPAIRVAQECGLADFLTHPATQGDIRNAQVRRLLRDPNGTVADACAALDSFVTVGVKEFYSLSVLLIAAKFGWPAPSRAYQRLNAEEIKIHPNHQRQVPPEPITPEITELLAELTKEDEVLYQHALSRFRRDFADIFDADVLETGRHLADPFRDRASRPHALPVQRSI